MSLGYRLLRFRTLNFSGYLHMPLLIYPRHLRIGFPPTREHVTIANIDSPGLVLTTINVTIFIAGWMEWATPVCVRWGCGVCGGE